MTFTDDAWADLEPVRSAIDEHPFLTGLADGTLPRERFTYYLAQDAHYLAAYSRVLAACAAQASRTGDVTFWATGSRNAIEVERLLHQSHVGDLTAYVPSPTCTAYTSYLQALASQGSYAVLVAGVLPCFWVYEDVGRRMTERVGDLTGHAYGDWIATYGDPAFAEATRTAIEVTDRLADESGAATRAAMLTAFSTATRYEWMFWDAAWRQEAWPV